MISDVYSDAYLFAKALVNKLSVTDADEEEELEKDAALFEAQTNSVVDTDIVS
jgi:hypothetical protein